MALLASGNLGPLKEIGPPVLPVLVELYPGGSGEARIQIANTFSLLAQPYEPAKVVLLRDVRSDNQALRLAVHSALGRVSADEAVLTSLFEIMRDDPNPLFRESAARSLANDQIHLNESGRFVLLSGLVDALEDRKEDVRRNAILALKRLTGETHGYAPIQNAAARKSALERWREFLRKRGQ